MHTLYIYGIEDGDLIGRVRGDSNTACEELANEIFGCNDCRWSYARMIGAHESDARNYTCDRDYYA